VRFADAQVAATLGCKLRCATCCMMCGEPGKKNAPVVHKPHAAIAAALPTKARRASRVLNTDARAAKVRSNRRAITETTALGCKVRCAKNAAKPSMARTNAQVVRALHVAFQVTNSGPAIFVLSMYALCGIATRHEPLDRQSFQTDRRQSKTCEKNNARGVRPSPKWSKNYSLAYGTSSFQPSSAWQSR
jgi:hypothetical protein